MKYGTKAVGQMTIPEAKMGKSGKAPTVGAGKSSGKSMNASHLSHSHSTATGKKTAC